MSCVPNRSLYEIAQCYAWFIKCVKPYVIIHHILFVTLPVRDIDKLYIAVLLIYLLPMIPQILYNVLLSGHSEGMEHSRRAQGGSFADKADKFPHTFMRQALKYAHSSRIWVGVGNCLFARSRKYYFCAYLPSPE